MSCLKCHLEVLARKLNEHIDDGQCRARQREQELKAHGLIAPSSVNANIRTVTSLAKRADIKLSLEPIRVRDYGTAWKKRRRELLSLDDMVAGEPVPTERYMLQSIYVAPFWLCRIAALSGGVGNIPRGMMRRLREAALSVPLQNAFITQLTLMRESRRKKW